MEETVAAEPPQLPADELERDLARLQDLMRCQIDFDEWLGGGRSGGPVALIVRSGPGFDDKVAIKFARMPEVGNWRLAISDCPPEFLRQHLVNLETVFSQDAGPSGWWIATLKIAGGDVSLFRPSVELDPLKGAHFASSCATIVKSIIEDWNPEPLPHPLEPIPPASYLNSIFDASRAIPSKPSWRWLDSLDITCTDVLVRRDGWQEALPNPLALAARLSSEPFCSRPLRVRFGRAHGDLNLGNVLMPVDPPRPEEYKLIDLGGFSPKAPLARDPMHLLLSIAIEWLKSGINPGTRLSRTLIDLIVRPGARTTEEECQKVSQEIHAAGHSWAARKGLGDDWTRQSMLSLVGCGMLYARPKNPRPPRHPCDSRVVLRPRGGSRPCLPGACSSLGSLRRGASPPPQRSGSANISPDQPAPEESRPGAPTPRPAQQSSEPEPDEYAGPQPEESSGARILQFPPPATRNDHGTVDGAEPHQAGQQDQWEDMTDALQRAVFDPSNWLSLAAGTDALLRQIQETREMGLPSDDDIARNLQLLDRTLTGVSGPLQLRPICTPRARALKSFGVGCSSCSPTRENKASGVAAAARNGDADRVKKEVQDRLTILWARCRSPAALEKNIVTCGPRWTILPRPSRSTSSRRSLRPGRPPS